jgi:hypothetical protein
VLPIRIARGGFAPNVPCRDLYLSPDHAVFAEGGLIPVKYLLNGHTIRRETRRNALHCLQIEVDAHDILLAENLPVELSRRRRPQRLCQWRRHC